MIIRHRLAAVRSIVAVLVFLIFSGCASRGKLTDHYGPDYYQVPKLLDEAEMKHKNPVFLVYGDTQAGWRIYEKFLREENWKTPWMLAFPFYQIYWLGNGIYGLINYQRTIADIGADTRLMMREVMYQQAKQLPADFILNLGDICSSKGTHLQHWEVFIDENKINHPLLQEIPYVPVPGNHDYTNDSTGISNYQAVFQRPRNYTVEFKDGVLIAMDSNLMIDQRQLIPDDLQDRYFEEYFVSAAGGTSSWLEEQLLRFGNKPHKILAMHHPLITFAKHHKDWLRSDYGRDLLTKRDKFIELLKQHQVDVIFSGHEHLYQHVSIPYEDEMGAEKALHFVTSSSGGVPLRRVEDEETLKEFEDHFSENNLAVQRHELVSVHHYTEVRMDAEALYLETWQVSKETGKQESVLEKIVVRR